MTRRDPNNPKATVLTVRVDDTTSTHLREIQDRDGVPVSEQVRRGIALWLESRGIKAERKRGATRKRS